MKRIVTIATAALALALTSAAFAQDPFDDPDDEPVPGATATPGPVPEATVTPGCERGPGTDADYAYCPDPCIDDESTDADYVYCVVSDSGGGPPPRPKRRTRASAVPLPAQTLPLTGGEPWLIAACGTGFLLAGSGLRLRARAR